MSNLSTITGINYLNTSKVTNMGSMFSGCSSLTEIVIPGSITAIEKETFQGCSALTELIVPEGVTRIGSTAFCTCVNLRVITLPAGLVEIGDRAFEYCPEELLIKAPAGSRAEQYARENGYRFEALPESAD